MRYILYILSFIIASLLGSMTYANEPISIWWDIDTHGCIASAGYSWEPRARQCLRPWESRVSFIFVAPNKQTCNGLSPSECLQIRRPFDGSWTSLYGDIAGFNYTEWYIYRLMVLETHLDNPPVDSPSIWYSFLRVLSKSRATMHEDAPFIGDWKLTRFNNTDVSSANFKNRFSIKLCNNINGEYSLNGNIFVAPNSVSTMMYCEWLPMTLENVWNLNGATYSLIAIRRMAGSVGPTMQVTITMRSGNSFIFSN